MPMLYSLQKRLFLIQEHVSANRTPEMPNVYAGLQGTGAGVGDGVASDDTTTQRNRRAGTGGMTTYETLLGNSPGVDGLYENDNPYEVVDDA